MIFSLRHIQSIDLLREILVFSMVKIYITCQVFYTNIKILGTSDGTNIIGKYVCDIHTHLFAQRQMKKL
jgi:surface polysaccharide O-acyltransferase-like enzyme